MSVFDLKKLLLGTSLFVGVAAVALPSYAYAQDEEEDSVDLIDEETEEAIEESSSGDTVVITGSRLRKDTFSSISPLQVITAEDSLDVGLIDPSQILQQSTAAAGAQFDSTFQGFVLDNGPGSETLNLRGLGADRTLLLINGRRMAPAGVEGAPTQPSINLLPGSLIDRYDLLLDGASSVYGSDAVAGVGNVILKKDFEGLELFASGDYNVAGAGSDYTVSGAWGKNNDRGFFGVGVEYDYRDQIQYSDRDFLAGCDQHYEETEDGEIRIIDQRSAYETEFNTNGYITAKKGICKQGGFTNRVFEQDPLLTFGSAYSTPGYGNIIPNYSDTGFVSVPLDQDMDGVEDIYFADFTTSRANEDYIPEQKRLSAMAYGEYTFEGDMNITPFFEFLYTQINVDADGGPGGLSAVVPADNPFNVCNPNAPGGIDCGQAELDLIGTEAYGRAFRAYYAGDPDAASCFGIAPCDPVIVLPAFGINFGPIGAGILNPQVQVPGHFQYTEVELAQTRGVAGVRGDLPFLNVGSLSDWSFEASLVYSHAQGDSSRTGIRKDRLALALGYDPTIDINANGVADDVDLSNASVYLGTDGILLPGGACDTANVANPELLTDTVASGCVPVNLFARSLYVDPSAGISGDLGSQAERDYLFDTRDFDTVYEQTVLNAFVTGTLFDLPAGGLGAVLGAEYRIDEIDSQPDDIAAFGQFPGYFRDRGVEGEKYTAEVFGELEIPVLAAKPLAEELTFNLSGRYTKDELAGSDSTYSIKAAWRPITPLLFKGTYGTSFKAPNLREQFFLGQSGFGGVTDPCSPSEDVVNLNPATARYEYDTFSAGSDVDGDGINDQDDRSPDQIAACQREGRNPFTVGVIPESGQVLGASPEVFTVGGVNDLENETSESASFGFAFEQPWFESFDLTLGATYYDIQIENAIVELSYLTIIDSCFPDEDTGRSPFCDLITYTPPYGLINEVNTTFINRDEETATGIDYNARFSKEFTAFDQPMEFGLNIRANQLKERVFTLLDQDTGAVLQSNDLTNEFGFPEWSGFATATLDISDYRFTWETRYIDSVTDDVVDPFSNVTVGGQADTCLGPDLGDVNCRDVEYADEYYVHTLAMRYAGDTMTLRAGISNVFDTDPPLVDSTTASATVRSNTPLGSGYNTDGRQYFFSIRKDF